MLGNRLTIPQQDDGKFRKDFKNSIAIHNTTQDNTKPQHARGSTINDKLTRDEKILYEFQLPVMCTTHGERRLISIRCQKECLESKLEGQMDSHSDYSANFRHQVLYILFLLIISFCILFN